MKTNEEITKRIMRKVYLVYTMRQIGQPVVRAGVVIALIMASLSFVSVSHVFLNIGNVGTPSQLITFVASAFLETEFFVQFAVLGIGAIGFWSMVDLLKRGSVMNHAHA